MVERDNFDELITWRWGQMQSGKYSAAAKAGRGGVNWSTYWATLISATVENAAPTHVVLTFPTAKTALGASDFTIAGFTVSSASWTGAVLTLVLSTAVLVFNEDLTITFVKTGETGVVTNNVIDDGNTVGWYDLDLTTITKDGSDLVSQWNDKLGGGNNLTAVTTERPTYQSTGILFNGTTSRLIKDFSYKQPATVYLVVKQITWTHNDYFIDGYNKSSMVVAQFTTTPGIIAYAGTLSSLNNNLALGTFGIVKAIFNGASSKIQVNNTAAVTGNFGTAAANGIVIGGFQESTSQCSNIEVKEAIFRKVSDSSGTEALITNYLKSKHGLFFLVTDGNEIFNESKMNNSIIL